MIQTTEANVTEVLQSAGLPTGGYIQEQAESLNCLESVYDVISYAKWIIRDAIDMVANKTTEPDDQMAIYDAFDKIWNDRVQSIKNAGMPARGCDYSADYLNAASAIGDYLITNDWDCLAYLLSAHRRDVMRADRWARGRMTYSRIAR